MRPEQYTPIHHCRKCDTYLEDILCPRCGSLMVKEKKPGRPRGEQPSKWNQERKDMFHSQTEKFTMTPSLLRRLHQSGIRD